jgi:hypothetical protein
MSAAVAWWERSVPRDWGWWVALALPVLPLVSLFDRGAASWSAVNGWGLVVLVGMGVWMALVGERWMARLDRRVAKEVKVLKWLALGVVFAAQLPMVLHPGEGHGGVMVLAVLGGALVSVVTWGVEFQQRTLGSMLSQPWSRADWWRTKMGVLAGVLGWTWATLLASLLVADGSVQFPGYLAAHAGLLVLLWATVPAWTLLTRSALPGLVFAVAVPSLALTGIAALVSLVMPEDRVILEDWGKGGVVILLAVYAVWGWRWSRRLWERMEAVDSDGAETGGLFLGRFWGRKTEVTGVSRIQGTRNSRPWWVQAAIKEMRLQSVSLVVLVMGFGLVMVREIHEWSIESGTWISAVTVLMGSVGFLMAGVTSVAEERRLGVLEAQALWPVSRGRLWLVKMGVTLAVMGVSLLVVEFGLRESLGTVPGWGRLVPSAIFMTLGSAALLVSSGAANGLRALLLTLALAGVAFVMGFILVKEVPRHWEQARYLDLELSSDRMAPWEAKAKAMEPTEVEKLRVWVLTNSHGDRWIKGAWLILIPMPVVLGSFLALWFSWRNYRRPGEAPHKILGQAAMCLCVFGVSAVVGAVVIRQRLAEVRVREMLVHTRSYLDWREQLGSVDRMLLERYPANEGKLWWVRGIWARFPQGKTAEPREGWGLRNARRMFSGQVLKDFWYVPLPLDATNRVLLLERAELDPEIREALLREAATQE